MTEQKYNYKPLSEKFKERFLYEFSKELVKSSKGGSIIRLRHIVEKEREKEKEKEKLSKEKKQEVPKPAGKTPEKEKISQKVKQRPKIQPQPPRNKQSLKIPEPKLPERFNYMKPMPKKADIELGKLDPLVKDPNVKRIECSGPDENITVSGNMGTNKPTGITLNEEDLNEIVDKFSKKAMIPVNEEGTTKIVVGNLVLKVAKSETLGTKFEIQKMTPQHPSQAGR